MNIVELQKALEGNNKISFFLMLPMTELMKYMRNGLLYLTNIAT